jgi:hypothetical protein
MRLSRKHRVVAALIALFGMLFMQLAVASYACPGLPGNGSRQAMADAMETMEPMPAMPGCDQAGPAKPALCHAHCLDGKSALDKPQTPVAAPAAVMVSAILTPIEPLLPASSSGGPPEFALSRITSPPIAIRHCCFRI